MADSPYETNPNNRRSVKYVVSRVLRRIAQETDHMTAKQSDYQTVYEHLVDMLMDFQDRGFVVASKIPESIDDNMGNQDPISAIINVLTVRVAPFFFFEPTVQQTSQASAGMRLIRNRNCRLPKMCRPSRMPRGSGNRFTVVSEDNCEDQLLNNQGVPIVL